VKTITLEIEDSVYEAAERLAAQRQSSVDELAREALAHAVEAAPSASTAAEQDAAQRRELADLFRKANLVLGYKPSRDKTYER
jgi:uncharacterized membrane protein YqiK